MVVVSKTWPDIFAQHQLSAGSRLISAEAISFKKTLQKSLLLLSRGPFGEIRYVSEMKKLDVR